MGRGGYPLSLVYFSSPPFKTVRYRCIFPLVFVTGNGARCFSLTVFKLLLLQAITYVQFDCPRLDFPFSRSQVLFLRSRVELLALNEPLSLTLRNLYRQQLWTLFFASALSFLFIFLYFSCRIAHCAKFMSTRASTFEQNLHTNSIKRRFCWARQVVWRICFSLKTLLNVQSCTFLIFPRFLID